MNPIDQGNLPKGVEVSDSGAGRPEPKAALRHGIALVDPRHLSRSSLTNMLSTLAGGNRFDDFSVCSFASTAELSAAQSENGPLAWAMILVNLGALCPLSNEARAMLDPLRAAYQRVPVMVLTDCANSGHVQSTLADGIRGYITSSMDSAMLIHAIRMVIAGGTFPPLEALVSDGGDEPFAAGSDDTVNELVGSLTPRQAEVFALLKQGRSNKFIAHELNMHESTVKVHVRHIMHKFKATNRTHAVYLANAGKD